MVEGLPRLKVAGHPQPELELLEMQSQPKVLVASGYSRDAIVEECPRIGGQGFEGKPFQLVELLRQVRGILDEK
jgi:hypothetical protein